MPSDQPRRSIVVFFPGEGKQRVEYLGRRGPNVHVRHKGMGYWMHQDDVLHGTMRIEEVDSTETDR